MPKLNPPTDPASTPTPIPPNLTLDPIVKLGTAALDTTGHPTLASITLRLLEASRDSNLHETISIASDDLLSPSNDSTGALHTIPPDASLRGAVLDFHFTDADRPHPVRLRLPATVSLEYPADAPRVFSWLKTSRLALKDLGAVASIIALAIAAALAPALSDGDGDDDDPVSDRHILRA